MAIPGVHSIGPPELDEIRRYHERARKYRGECGCSLGAIFLMVSVGISVLFVGLFPARVAHHALHYVGVAIAFVFSSTIVGKLTGISVVRVRLAPLHRQFVSRYHAQGD